MFNQLFAPVVSLVETVVDRIIPDKTQAAALKAAITTELLTLRQAEIRAAADVIIAEATGESWLQRNWRPLLMTVCIAIVANNYILFPYANLFFSTGLALELPEPLWNLMSIGVGGYIVGRSGEKMVKAYKQVN
jgi:hypothetical protein